MIQFLLQDKLSFAMHAYLITGGNSEERLAYSEKLAEKLKAKILEFPFAKIEDARNLKSFLSLKVTAPTAVLLKNVDLATEETLNAFLKSLEEAQENLFFFLTAQSAAKVLPTVASRCQIIRVQSTEYQVPSTEPEKFLNKTIGEKLAVVDKIKDRGEAQEFIGNLINFCHFNLLKSPKKMAKTAQNLEILTKTFNNLKANGNVSLQLTNLVINLYN